MNAPAEPGSATASPSMRAGRRRSPFAGRECLVSALAGAILVGPVWWFVDSSIYTRDDRIRGSEYREVKNFDQDERPTDSYEQCTAVAWGIDYGGHSTEPQSFSVAGKAFWEACTGTPMEVAY